MQSHVVIDEVIFGDKHVSENIFQYQYVELNLPGEDYKPRQQRVTKGTFKEMLAVDAFTYIDDQQICAFSEIATWLVA